jgi:hypothetical protein
MPKGKGNNQHHIVPHENGWAVVRSGSAKPTRVLPTKREAENVGREISRNQQTELVIHGQNGQIQRRDSHGNDPHPPKN